MLTVVGGKVVYGAGEFDRLGPPQRAGAAGLVAGGQGAGPLAAVGRHRRPQRCTSAAARVGCMPTAMKRRGMSSAPVSDFQGFWGALRLFVLRVLS